MHKRVIYAGIRNNLTFMLKTDIDAMIRPTIGYTPLPQETLSLQTLFTSPCHSWVGKLVRIFGETRKRRVAMCKKQPSCDFLGAHWVLNNELNNDRKEEVIKSFKLVKSLEWNSSSNSKNDVSVTGFFIALRLTGVGGCLYFEGTDLETDIRWITCVSQ